MTQFDMNSKGRVKHLVEKLNNVGNACGGSGGDRRVGKRLDDFGSKSMEDVRVPSKIPNKMIHGKRNDGKKSTAEDSDFPKKIGLQRKWHSTLKMDEIQGGNNMEEAKKKEFQLSAQIQELKEQNELLEFRLLELEYGRQINDNCGNVMHESDDISDSGVMSLSPCEDFIGDDMLDKFDEDGGRISGSEISEKLCRMCLNVESFADRNTLQQAADLLKHYEIRVTSMETTLHFMCQEKLENELSRSCESLKSKAPRVVATVTPFPSYEKEICRVDGDWLGKKQCESGIFEDGGDRRHQGTQTHFDEPTTTMSELTREIAKLDEIRARLQKRGGGGKGDAINRAKQLVFYKEQYDRLKSKIAAYEMCGDSDLKSIGDEIRKQNKLDDEVKYLTEKVDRLSSRMRQLEEEKCEFEEAENDARLQCQKLEAKMVEALESKNDLQCRLRQSYKTVADLRKALSDLRESDDYRERRRVQRVVEEYEERNFQLEEKILTVEDGLRFLTSILPLIVIWHALETEAVTFSPDRNDNGKRARDLERALGLKEYAYEETLRRADEMISNVERDCTSKLEDMQATLGEKVARLERCEAAVKRLKARKEAEEAAADRISGLESEIGTLKRCLRMKEEDKKMLMEKEKLALAELDKLKGIKEEMEVEFKKKLEAERNELKEIRAELKYKREEIRDLDAAYSEEVKLLKNKIQKLARETENQEVNNGELKEEVETLENVIYELKKQLQTAMDEKEKITISLEKKLARKRQEIDSLKLRYPVRELSWYQESATPLHRTAIMEHRKSPLGKPPLKPVLECLTRI